MQALVSFLSDLCTASHLQLIQMNSKCEEEEMLNIGSKLPTNALLLYRLQEVLMKVLHTGRPLLHLVQAYNAVSTHLVEASGNPDRRISKMAVTCMHDYITAVLSTHPERSHFYVNELLCKGFESLFSQDMCDGDVQDQEFLKGQATGIEYLKTRIPAAVEEIIAKNVRQKSKRKQKNKNTEWKMT